MTVFLESIDVFVFVMEMNCFLIELRTVCLYKNNNNNDNDNKMFNWKWAIARWQWVLCVYINMK